ncbi:MAG: P-loop NTPase [Myxococcota bacterium]
MKPAPGRIISVGGGKGGVGKSLVACNLAVACAQHGRSVVLVDADLGAPNLHTLLGVERMPRTLDSLFDHQIESLAEARLPTLIPGLELIAGSPAHPGAANIPHAQKLKLLRHIASLEADVVMVDVGAGTSFNALDVFNVADLRLVVTTPQLTAIQNAYAFLKGAVHRLVRQLSPGPEQLEWLSDGQVADTARMKGLLARVHAQSPAFAEAIELLLGSMGVFLVGNQAADATEANVTLSVSRMIADFLSVDARVLGTLRTSRRAHESVNLRRPWLLDPMREPSMLTCHSIAEQLLQVNVAQLRKARGEAEVLAGRASDDVRAEETGAQGRKHPRLPIELPVTLASGTVSIEGQTLDLSHGGALISTPDPLPPATRWRLCFTSLRGAPSVDVLVRRVRAGKALAGVEFATTSPLPPSLLEVLSNARVARAA